MSSSCQTPNYPYPSSLLHVSPPFEELLIRIPGAILNLIDINYSLELASGDFCIVRLRQGSDVIAVLARLGDDVQWPLAKDEPAVKLDHSHYFFSLRLPHESGSILNYGLTIACKGQEHLIAELDGILECYSFFSVHEGKGGSFMGVSPLEVAYWTALAPNVEDYSSTAAKLIASGSGQLIKGILRCGDVTVDQFKWGNEVVKNRMSPGSGAEISPDTLDRIKRVKRMTKMTEEVANGVLSGVIKVSGLFTGSVANSKVGKKFFSLLPGEIVLASLDGFNKVCDAVEVAGRNVMSASSTVTTDLVSHRYGEEAGKATNEGLDAAGHAIGTAWAAFKIRKALNPKSVLKPSTLVKSAAAEMKSTKSK